MRLWICCFLVLCGAAPARAQSPPDLKRWDVAGSIGWLAGDKSDFAEDWNDWYDTFAASVDVGHYWTPHLKTELGGTFTSDGSVYSHDVIPAPGGIVAHLSREHAFQLKALNASAVYQFLDNQWVHPFVHAGVQFGWERERVVAPEQLIYGRDPRSPVVVPPLLRTEEPVFSAVPFAGFGAKFYVNERGFIRTDFTLGWHRGGIGQGSWRAGMGVDF